MRSKTVELSDKILDAAIRLFGERRFHEVRMEDVALAAEVGKGTIYRYFADKEELYHAMLGRSTDLFMTHMEELAAAPGPPRARLIALVESIIGHFDTEPHLLDLIQRAEVLSSGGMSFPWQRTRERLPQLLQDLFAEACASGDFVIRDAPLTVLMLLGGIRAVIRFGERPRPNNLGARIVAYFLEGAAGQGLG